MQNDFIDWGSKGSDIDNLDAFIRFEKEFNFTLPETYKNLVRFMSEDGFFKFLPKKDDAWVDFVRPFMKLSRKEKKH
jgi:hypothetical protein